jgi:hypothetical protein
MGFDYEWSNVVGVERNSWIDNGLIVHNVTFSAMVRLSSMLTSISQHLHTGIEQPRVPNNYYGIGRNGNEI